mmetsp:Transcript_81582/g.205276  ORF Transcript_81582/g.205276 Transcript_81582/m.205276 type:complete len:98 (+) Transcript_81582:103-396(+)
MRSSIFLGGRFAVGTVLVWVVAVVVLVGTAAATSEATEASYLESGFREDVASLLACAVGVLFCRAHVQTVEAEADAGGLAPRPRSGAPKVCIPLLWL